MARNETDTRTKRRLGIHWVHSRTRTYQHILQMNLSEHFTLEELIRSEKAEELHIDNTPPPFVIENLRHLCINVLEPLREKIGKPIHITSGYRCPELNAAIAGSAKTSQHQLGEAADTHVDGMSVEEWFQFVKKSGVIYDQLIQEFDTWVHISHHDAPRMMALRASKSNGQTSYTLDGITA